MKSDSPWQSSSEVLPYPPLNQDLTMDALVAEGDITWITAAYLLVKAGKC